jgi:RNA polymerase sigma-70 factor (ECF subfamily)
MILLPLLFAVIAEDETELVRRLQKRDPQALGELYDKYGRLAFSLIYRIVRDVGTAEDLVQETFLRVWNRSQGFDGERGALGGWLLAVARNRAIDYIRSSGGKMARGSLDLEYAEHPSTFVNFESDLLTRDREMRVRKAVDRLNENQRHVIELAYFEGLSQSEMAERMGQPLGTVKTWVRSALKNLREELGEKAVTA